MWEIHNVHYAYSYYKELAGELQNLVNWKHEGTKAIVKPHPSLNQLLYSPEFSPEDKKLHSWKPKKSEKINVASSIQLLRARVHSSMWVWEDSIT